MEWVTKAIALLKLPVRIIAFFAIITGFLLFLPQNIINILKLTEFIKEYGKYFGIAFLVSAAYLLFLLIPFLYKYFKNVYSTRKREKEFLENIVTTLINLSYREKCLLREFIIQDKGVIEAPIENTEVTSLINKGIIEIASRNVRRFIFGNYIFIQINKKAIPFLNNESYGLPNSTPTPQDIDKVKRERPDYLTRIESINDLMNGRRRRY